VRRFSAAQRVCSQVSLAAAPQGYPTVTVTHGAAGGPQTVTTTTSYRGFDSDAKNSTDGQSVVWGSRRVGLTTAIGTQNMVAALAGGGTKCLDLSGYGTTNGTNVQLWDCTGASNQVWQAVSNNAGAFSLKNPVSGRCLDLSGYGTANGTNAQLWDCTGAANQLWQRQPDGSWRNPVSGRCLDTAGASTANGTNVRLWDCSAGWNQMWQPQSNGAMVSVQASRCVDLAGYGTTNGTHVQTWNCTGATNQMWQAQANGTVKNPVSGRCLDIANGGTANGTLVQLWDYTGAGNQIWVPQADGTLKNPASGRCLDVGATPVLGTQMQIWDCSGVVGQTWVNWVTDPDGAQGFQREEADLDGAQIAKSTIKTPTVVQTALRNKPVNGGQDITAHQVLDTETQTRTWIAQYSRYRWTDTQTTYNSYGLPTLVKDLGDTSTDTDDTCASTSYVTPDTNRWLVDFPAQETTTDCAATPGDADYLSGSQTFYDGSSTNGATPTQGLPTRTNDLASVSGGVLTWKQNDRTDYDANGRETAKYDGLDRRTATAYTPASGAPVTSKVETDPMGWTSTTTLDPGRDLTTGTVDVNGKVTTARYDPLGRLAKVWTNNRTTDQTPDLQYTYTLSGSSANWVETQKLGPAGTQVASFAIFDGQLRLRQNQDPAPVANGGRMITDTTYDGRGLKSKLSTFANTDSGPSGTLVAFTDAAVPTQDRYSYDNLERETVNAFYTMGNQEWQTTHVYDGDRTAEIPPAGGVTTQKLFDADGKMTELRQFTSTNLSGSYQATDYTYDRQDKLTKVVDSTNNTWTWSYDLRGREVSKSDPDSGTTTSTYDDADQLLSTTDGRGTTLAYAYDNLGRKTGEYRTSTTGTQLAGWTYDTLARGQLSSSTSYSGSDAYTVAVTGYDDAYRPLGHAVTVPASQGSALAGTWTTSKTYNIDGTVASMTYPAAGGLGTETVAYTYDANGYELTAAGLDTYVSATQYQPWGDVYQRTLGSGSTRVQATTDEWADTHHVRTISAGTEHTGTPGTFDEQFTQQYNWTPAGTVSSIDDQHGGTTTGSQCFTYDFLQRLTTTFTTTPALGGCAATPSASTVGGPDAYWQTYTYDASGNRRTLVSHGLGGAGDTTTTYTYPAAGTAKAHTLSSLTTSGPAGSTSNTYTYGGIGQQSNVTVNGQSTDFAWTDQGKVASATIHATGGDQTVNYVYDADGNELLRAAPAGRTLYLGETELNANAAGTALTTVTRYYTCGDTIVASRTNPGTLSWLVNDDQDTAQVAVDQGTLAVSIRKQDPFGNPRGTVPVWPNSRGFVGGTVEPTGLMHLGARQYDPTTGRFISDDPVSDTDNPQQLNGYAYAYNSPVTYSDPTGLWGWHSFFKAVATVASVASIIPGPIGMIAAGVSAISYAAAGDWANAGIMAAGIALSAVGAGAAVLAVKAVRVAREVRAIRSGVTALSNAGRTARTLFRAGRAVAKGFRAVGNKIRNGNNFLRIGRPTSGARVRLSIGPAPRHYRRLSRFGRFMSPIHIHAEWRKVGIDFNWTRRSYYKRW